MEYSHQANQKRMHTKKIHREESSYFSHEHYTIWRAIKYTAM